MSNGEYGLGDPLQLEKIDKLFACGVGDIVKLPQIVVVGDQSSGKSSVLEGLIKKPLPRDSGLCTRFATQFVFRRAASEKIFVSLIPDSQATEAHKHKVQAWKKDLQSLDSEAFTQIMQEVHSLMGLSSADNDPEQKPTFSSDVLCLEIAGPDQEHLSVIDVPGIFKSTTAGITTKEDIDLVRNMVLGYMRNPRSVMLAVIPANVDVATQEILELAKAADVDPQGDRTLGILTKPDLVDRGAESKVIGLVDGSSWKLKLGWHLVRNPGQQDLSDSSLDRGKMEMKFFRFTAPWNGLPQDRVGVESLRGRLKEILARLIKREFPKVQQEIRTTLLNNEKELLGMGPERESSAAQMASLTEIATKFQRIVSLALAANYGADGIFQKQPNLRIASSVSARMNAFSDDMARYGQQYAFLPESHVPDGKILSSDKLAALESGTQQYFFTRKQPDVDEIADILHPEQSLSHSVDGAGGAVLQWIQEVYQKNRGFELGTFNSSLLATTMKEQSSKWSDISLGYVSDVVVLVHNFITTALESVCPDNNMRVALLRIMMDSLIARYQQAIDHVSFLIRVENDGTPMTLNHYFNDNLQKSREKKVTAAAKPFAQYANASMGMAVNLENLTKTQAVSNEVHIIYDIHDILKSYYKVTRKTFVDNVCKQACDHFLLTGLDESPLNLFLPVFVSRLSVNELEQIAGEPSDMTRKRATLRKKIGSLTEAKKVLARA